MPKLKGVLITAILLLLAWNSVVCVAGERRHDLYDVHNLIAQKGAKWIAGETPISRLPAEERQKRAGGLLRETRLTTLGVLAEPDARSVYTLPYSIDWRNNGGDFVSDIKDQGSCGSCWAFATVAALESCYMIANNLPGQNIDLSEQVVLSCSGAGTCKGGSVTSASSFIKSTGAPDDSYYPYTVTNGSCSNAQSGWQNNAKKINAYNYVSSTDTITVDQLKNALFNYGPIVVVMAVYDDFYYYINGVYSRTSDVFEGYHAVLVVGYDDTNSCFIVKNSWGTEWGEQGYFRIAYSQVSDSVRFGIDALVYRITAPTACSYAINPSAFFVNQPGATEAASVSSGTSCTWNASSNVPWITIVSGSSGSGNGTINFSVSANTGATTRTGTITVTGSSGMGYAINITQEGVTCVFALSALASSSGAVQSKIAVIPSDPACPWEASTTVPWITITSGASGTGTASLAYTLLANPGVTQRSGAINVGGSSFHILQDAKACTYTLSPTSTTLTPPAGSGSFSVSTQPDCPWFAATDNPWISITSGTSGYGNGSVGYVVAENTGSARAGLITAGGQVFTINQSGASGATRRLTVVRNGTGSVNSTDNIINCGTVCTADLPDNSTIVLNAVASGSAVFKGWSGACIGTGKCTVKMTSDKKVTATFQ